MKVALEALISTIIGASIIIAGTQIPTKDIITDAKRTANQASVYQPRTALELYYLDHQSYPAADKGEELIEELYKEGYILNQPADSSVFRYQSIKKGQDYRLDVVKD